MVNRSDTMHRAILLTSLVLLSAVAVGAAFTGAAAAQEPVDPDGETITLDVPDGAAAVAVELPADSDWEIDVLNDGTSTSPQDAIWNAPSDSQWSLTLSPPDGAEDGDSVELEYFDGSESLFFTYEVVSESDDDGDNGAPDEPVDPDMTVSPDGSQISLDVPDGAPAVAAELPEDAGWEMAIVDEGTQNNAQDVIWNGPGADTWSLSLTPPAGAEDGNFVELTYFDGEASSTLIIEVAETNIPETLPEAVSDESYKAIADNYEMNEDGSISGIELAQAIADNADGGIDGTQIGGIELAQFISWNADQL